MAVFVSTKDTSVRNLEVGVVIILNKVEEGIAMDCSFGKMLGSLRLDELDDSSMVNTLLDFIKQIASLGLD